MKNKLIEIYLLVCHIYDMNKHLHLQENRNKKPTITASELMTIYLFGNLNGHFKKRHSNNKPLGQFDEAVEGASLPMVDRQN